MFGLGITEILVVAGIIFAGIVAIAIIAIGIMIGSNKKSSR